VNPPQIMGELDYKAVEATLVGGRNDKYGHSLSTTGLPAY
jgi:hypothetical protein